MNLGLSQSNQLDQSVKNELEQMVAAITQGWLTEHQLDGQHTAPTELPFNPAVFFTNQVATDIVVPGPQTANRTFLYQVSGGCMWLQVMQWGVTIANTPQQIRVLLPEGWYTSDHAIPTMGWCSDNGTQRTIVVSTIKNTRHVNLLIVPAANWANATATAFGFTARFRVHR